MKNSKGQALIEFVIILPILLLILLYIIDFSRITIEKYKLEHDLDLIVDMYKSNKPELENYIQENNIDVSYNKDDKLVNIKISKKVKYNMPLLKKIFKEKLETTRTIYYEDE